MDLLNDKVGYLYRKFLLSSFGRAFITSVYGLVDMIMIGQYHGPDGSAAMAVISSSERPSVDSTRRSNTFCCT